jgi:hypothetical protein
MRQSRSPEVAPPRVSWTGEVYLHRPSVQYGERVMDLQRQCERSQDEAMAPYRRRQGVRRSLSS